MPLDFDNVLLTLLKQFFLTALTDGFRRAERQTQQEKVENQQGVRHRHLKQRAHQPFFLHSREHSLDPQLCPECAHHSLALPSRR